MKATVGALMMSTSAMVIGMVVALESTALTVAVVQQGGISAATPVQGLTVGLLVVAGSAALVAALKAAHSLVLFTLACGKWIEQMNAMVDRVSKHQEELDALQRWRVSIVDPSLVRSGIGKPNPVSELQGLYDEEAAG